jgi:subtilisin family serine protease
MARKPKADRQRSHGEDAASGAEPTYALVPQEDVLAEIDPHLQELILAARAGHDLDESVTHIAADGSMQADVIAKLVDPSQPVPGLTVVRTVGQLVTGTADLERIEAVRQHPNVLTLKLATRVYPALRFSAPEIRGDSTQLRNGLPASLSHLDGTGVIVGIVDYGCDFAHRNFRNADGTTRIRYLWDQRGERSAISPVGFGYGREYTAQDLNAALQMPSPVNHLAYLLKDSSHGCHVMDIAAGNGSATQHPGIAPGAELIFVHLAANDFDEEETSFGNSRRLLEAVDYIFNKADELSMPAVVNLSLGTHGGPHDGTTPAEQWFELLLEKSNRAIIIAAGNAWEQDCHAAGMIAPGEQRILHWIVEPADPTGNELEVWYPHEQELLVTLITPGGQRLGPVPKGPPFDVTRNRQRIGRISHRRSEPNSGDHNIDILLRFPVEGGIWKVEIENIGNSQTDFHAWIERDDRGRSRFAPVDSDRSHTLGSISCGAKTIVVGSYDARLPGRELSFFTSAGPTRDGKQKPEVSAPGHAISAARSTTQTVTSKSGTSMAAPHVTGVVALLLQAADQPLSIEQIRHLVIDTCRRTPPVGTDWDARYGFGRVDCLGLLLSQLGLDATPHAENGTHKEIATVTTNGALPTGQIIPMSLLSAVANVANRSQSRIRVYIEAEPVT